MRNIKLRSPPKLSLPFLIWQPDHAGGLRAEAGYRSSNFDKRWILYVHADQRESDIMLMENTR